MSFPDDGKHLQLLVPLGTVPEVVTSSPAALAEYTKRTYNVELPAAQVRTVSLVAGRGQPATAVIATAGIKPVLPVPAPPNQRSIVEESKAVSAAHAAADGSAHSVYATTTIGTSRSPKRETAVEAASRSPVRKEQEVQNLNIDSLASVSQLLSLCHQQAKQISLLETTLAETKAAAADDGPRTALVAERGRNLLLHAELEDTKERLRDSEGTVQKFAGVIQQLKDDVRQLVEMHQVGDFHGNL